MSFFKWCQILQWVTILSFSFGFCILGGQLAYWVWEDKLIAQLVGLVWGLAVFKVGYDIKEKYQ